MKRSGFTLLELVIVVTIVAMTSAVSIGAWRAHLLSSEFNDTVQDIIAVFQEARGYAIKNVEIDGEMYDIYYVNLTTVADGFEITIDGDDTDTIETYSFEGVSTYPEEWSVYYEAPYGDFTVDYVDGEADPEDLEFAISSGELSQDIIVHKLSGIAEEVD